jgi:hypothetical protein
VASLATVNPRTFLGTLLVGSALLGAACASAPPAAPTPPVCPPPASAVPVASSTPPPARVVSVDDVSKELVAAYNARDPKRSFALMNGPMQAALPFDKEPAWIDNMMSKGSLLATRRVGGDGAKHGVYEVKAERGAFRVELNLDAEGKISGLQVKELKVEPGVAQSTLPISLPFKNEWLVFWGGDTPALNQHVGNPSQRRAADLVKVDPEGKDRKGDGKKNSDYFCFGAEILAVADGTVFMATDGLPDNEPGSMNPYAATGNTVVLVHEGGMHSLYAHLQNHSVKVKEGAKVKRGAVLGLCGNSGQSSQPHLHFHLQDGPRMESSWGIEPVFAEVRLTREGRTTKGTAYTFLKNDRIEPPR